MPIDMLHETKNMLKLNWSFRVLGVKLVQDIKFSAVVVVACFFLEWGVIFGFGPLIGD